MPEPLPDARSQVAAVTARAFPAATATIDPMPSGASLRKYFRVALAGDAGSPTSLVAMFVPDGRRPDELERLRDASGRWPFLEVRDLLAAAGVPVPAVLVDASDEGVLLLEDLGDATLAEHLLTHEPEREALYRQAILGLAEAQRRLSDAIAGTVVARRSFDETLLFWEIDHFREWILRDRLAPSGAAVFERAARWLAETIANLPRGFVHRDYQSRNLMVTGRVGERRLVWLDFQDALLGPSVYDLVALLNDSYQTFTPAFVDARLGEFADATARQGVDRDALREQFDLVTVQRKLKDAGRFVYVDEVNGNPSFLRFVPSTIERARAALVRQAHHAPLGELSRLLDDVLGAASEERG